MVGVDLIELGASVALPLVGRVGHALDLPQPDSVPPSVSSSPLQYYPRPVPSLEWYGLPIAPASVDERSSYVTQAEANRESAGWAFLQSRGYEFRWNRSGNARYPDSGIVDARGQPVDYYSTLDAVARAMIAEEDIARKERYASSHDGLPQPRGQELVDLAIGSGFWALSPQMRKNPWGR